MKKVLTILICLLIGAAANAQTKNDVLDRNFRLMMSWLEGEFDNSEQFYFEEEMKVANDLRKTRNHITFNKVDLPSIGEHVYYLEQYTNNDVENIVRKRLFSFSTDYENDNIRMEALVFKDTSNMQGAQSEPLKLNEITRDSMRILGRDCDSIWHRSADEFKGYIDPEKCTIESRRGGKLNVSGHFVLSKDSYWTYESGRREDGTYSFGSETLDYLKLNKARFFTCWMGVQNKEMESGWNFAANQSIHDQGGEIWMTKTGSNPEKMAIRLRNVQWPYGRGQDSLVIYALKEGQEKAVSYAWSEYNAALVGINLRWLQAGCTLNQ
ncbi:MAG: hypothetical protein HN583_08455 [Kordiimonadaceae bacterium]|jgi:hypothetical protein|nr:hypothetical protein [Kordiimonadaceae bacterium]MBT6466107.1 hypothetical protein [Kordiimonadaceae bacterium]MBT7605702.1 hypothetical protein [Kordiimonadaceae bacterium]